MRRAALRGTARRGHDGLVAVLTFAAAGLGRLDRDGQIGLDLGHAVAVVDQRFVRCFEVLIARRRRGGHRTERVTVREVHDEIDLPLAGNINLAGGAVSREGDRCVFDRLAVLRLRLGDRDRHALVAGKGDLRCLCAALGAHALVVERVDTFARFGLDRDRDRVGDLGDAVGVLRAGLARTLDGKVVVLGLDGHVLERIAFLEVDDKIDLPVARLVDLAGHAVARKDGLGIDCARVGTVLEVVYGHVCASVGHKAHRDAVLGRLLIHFVLEIPGAAVGVYVEIVDVVAPGVGLFVGDLVFGPSAVGLVGAELERVHTLLGEAGEVHVRGRLDLVCLLHEVLADPVERLVILVVHFHGLVEQILMAAELAEQTAAVLAGDIPAVDAQIVLVAGAAEAGAVKAQCVVVVPGGAALELVVVGHAVALEEDAAAVDLEILDVFVEQIERRGGIEIHVVGVVFALGVLAVGRLDRGPGVLEPGTDLLGRRGDRVGVVLVVGALGEDQIVADPLEVDEQGGAAAEAAAGDPAAPAAHAAASGGGADVLGTVADVEGRVAAVRDGVLFGIVVVFHQKAVVCHERVGLRCDQVGALILAVHPHIHGGAVLPDAHIVREIVGDLVAKQRVVVRVGEHAPLLGFRRVDAEELHLFVELEVVGALFDLVRPAVVASALDLRQIVLCAVDVDDALTGGFVVGIAVHRGDRAEALVDLDKDRLNTHGALIDLHGKGLGLAALGEGAGRLRAGRGDRQRTAGIACTVTGGVQSAVPGQKAFAHHGVAWQVEVILVRRAGGIRRQVDPGREPVFGRRCDRQRLRQIPLRRKNGELRNKSQ